MANLCYVQTDISIVDPKAIRDLITNECPPLIGEGAGEERGVYQQLAERDFLD